MTVSETLVPFAKITKISYGHTDGQWSCAVPDVIDASRNNFTDSNEKSYILP